MRRYPKGQREWERASILLALCLLFSPSFFYFLSDHILRVSGESMLPTIQDNAWVFSIWNKSTVERGDIVIIEVDKKDGSTYWLVKRVIGLVGDTIHVEAGATHIFRNGEPLDEPYLDPAFVAYGEGGTWVVPEGEIFVMGDNRGDSHDSRHVGTLRLERVQFILGAYFQF